MLSIALLVGLQFLGILVGTAFTLYLSAGLLLSLFYDTHFADKPATNVRLVIVTVADSHVREALMGTITHTVSQFSSYDVYCVLDEGSDLEPEVRMIESVETVVVPDSYECEAQAKGRAMQYFTEMVVEHEPRFWYAFIDDDNRILDDAFLYEIPYYDARGYRAMNPVLEPRRGDSVVTYMADQIRFVDDVAIYRLFTGILKRPYLGFHGELLCARGDVLSTIGFNRATIVEDFAFALELARRDIPTWQSQTRVSVLSPHDVTSFLKQRARWYWGVVFYLPNAPMVSRAVVGSRIATWSVAITSSWIFIPLWVTGHGFEIPIWLSGLLAVGTLLYVGTIGIGAVHIGGLYGFVLLLFVPIYATMEHLAPLYALWTRQSDFVVIDK